MKKVLVVCVHTSTAESFHAPNNAVLYYAHGKGSFSDRNGSLLFVLCSII
jgi:hypothetical protein